MTLTKKLENALKAYHMSRGKTEIEATVLVMEYFTAFVDRMAQTDVSVRKQVEQRLKSVETRTGSCPNGERR